MLAMLQEFAATCGPLQSLAIASAPALDERGKVIHWPNQPHWVGTPLASTLAQRLGCRVLWCDDGTAATMADAAALKVDNLLHLSLGTGVGGGVLIDGAVLVDRELGHLIVHPGGRPCSCGRRGCLQAYASARALLRDAPRTAQQECEWVRQASGAIALCTANLTELFRPDALSLSGGLLARFPRLPDEVADRLADNCVKWPLKVPRVVASPHGTRAALAGALLLARADKMLQDKTCRSITVCAGPVD